jgi:hypothetical protein
MKIIDAITQIDNLKPNNYTQEDKIVWLSRLDEMIKKEIIDTHEDGEEIVFEGYNEETPVETELLVPSPYDEIYPRWLEAQIDYSNSEYGRFNNSMTMFNTSFGGYANFYNRKHLPKGVSRKYF